MCEIEKQRESMKERKRERKNYVSPPSDFCWIFMSTETQDCSKNRHFVCLLDRYMTPGGFVMANRVSVGEGHSRVTP